MKKFRMMLLWSGFSILTLGGAMTGDPAKDQAASFVDLAKAERFGARYADGALHFSAGEKKATPARLQTKYDFTRGVRFDFEFRDNGKQFNPYPRLIQAGGLSIHLVNVPDGDRQFRITVDEGRGTRVGVINVKIGCRPGVWRKVSVYLDPVNRCFGFLEDGKLLAVKDLAFAPEGLRNVTVYLGGANASTQGTRGFSGSIRNLHVTTPFQAGALAPGSLLQPPAIRGKKLEHFTICALKGRHLAFPGAARLPDGTLAVVFREGEGHICPYGRVCIVYSRDDGKNWSAPIVVRDTVMDERDPSIQTLSDGRVLVTHGAWFAWIFNEYTRQKYPSETAFVNGIGYREIARQVSGTNFLFSHDGGKTFTEIVPVGSVFAPHGPAFYKGKFYSPSIANERGKRQVYMNVGSADAKSWQRFLIGECEKGGGRPAYEEPHTAVLPDGTLFTAIRVPQDGYLRTTRSTDGGQTWSKIEKTAVRGYPYHLLVLSDGRLLATYGYRYHPEGVRACLSADGGQTWELKNEFVLQNNGTGADLGYPVSLEMPDKRILTVYYHSDKRHDSCFIEGVFWKP